MAMRAVIHRTGGPEVIEWETVDLPPPAPGEVRLRTSHVGLNFIDTYFRSGLYPAPLPAGLGSESAGVVEAVGKGVDTLAPGDRVATFGPGLGAYATERNVPASTLFELPDSVGEDMAAAALLKGCTAEFLAERCIALKPGDVALVHAAAGGVGQILVQWLAHLGVTVIATVGSADKAAIATRLGAAHVIMYGEEDVAARVRALTGGDGCAVVYDGVGRDTWEGSLGATRRRGLVVSYGNASGPVEGVKLATLNAAGSLFVTRPKLFDYYTSPEERAAGARRLFEMIESGAVKVDIGQRFALKDAAAAHRALEARATTGSTLLVV